MSTLHQKMARAHREKPAEGQPCNRCGWCCLTKVCSAGVATTGSDVAPCKNLKGRPGKYRCALAVTDHAKKLLGIGTGCCAITVEEKLAAMGIEVTPRFEVQS